MADITTNTRTKTLPWRSVSSFSEVIRIFIKKFELQNLSGDFIFSEAKEGNVEQISGGLIPISAKYSIGGHGLNRDF